MTNKIMNPALANIAMQSKVTRKEYASSDH
jgi:hypothetical protein